METMERKQPRRRRSFTPEFKAGIVERCRAGDRTIGQVAKDFDPTETAFRTITAGVGVGSDWTLRELRHTFVSIMSDNDVPIEKIADLVGHRTTIVTQTVYRHQLRPSSRPAPPR